MEFEVYVAQTRMEGIGKSQPKTRVRLHVILGKIPLTIIITEASGVRGRLGYEPRGVVQPAASHPHPA